MKKALISCILLCFWPGILLAQVATAPSAGSGTQADPYQIATLENLYYMAAKLKWSRTAVSMAYKLCRCAEKRWQRIRGADKLAKVIAGIEFVDGVERNAA